MTSLLETPPAPEFDEEPHMARIAGAPISWGVCEVPGWGPMLDANRVLRSPIRVGSFDEQRRRRPVARRAGIAQVRGACSPQDKLQFLKALQASGQTVAMVGDGLNDGPVLAGA